MKNKRAIEVNPMSVIIAAAILLVVLFVFFYAILPIFTGKQIPFLKGQTEQVTEDCDRDEVIGLSDPCPCVKAIKSKEEFENKKNICGTPDSESTTNCPTLCKK